MFEETLLIIKPDYLHKRKLVLLKLLDEGFQIEGNRRLLFSPEHAGEFYETISEEKNYMLQVIELSKGNCEAFILTKENAIEELINTMICYFTNSVEMDKMVHTSKCPAAVQREVSYIFPNYIHEPIPWFDKPKFSKQRLPTGLIKELYDLIRTVDPAKESWKVRVAEWCMLSNKAVPIITHECSLKPFSWSQDQSEQAKLKRKTAERCPSVHSGASSQRPSLSSSSGGSSGLITSSSCMTCTSLGSHTVRDRISPSEILRKRTIPLMKTESCVLPSPSEAEDADDEVEAEPVVVAAEDQELAVEEDYPEYPIEGYVVTYGAAVEEEEAPEDIPTASASAVKVPPAEEGEGEKVAGEGGEVAAEEAAPAAAAEVTAGAEEVAEAQPPAAEEAPAAEETAAQPEAADQPQHAEAAPEAPASEAPASEAPAPEAPAPEAAAQEEAPPAEE